MLIKKMQTVISFNFHSIEHINNKIADIWCGKAERCATQNGEKRDWNWGKEAYLDRTWVVRLGSTLKLQEDGEVYQ